MKKKEPKYSCAVEVHDLTVSYRESPVLWDIDLKVAEQNLVAIVGPNGAGKSTLLKTIVGLLKPISGKVSIYDKEFRIRRSWVAYVPQREDVDWDFPITVRDVATMGTYGELGWFKRPKKQQIERAQEALRRVGLQDLQTRQIGELSGGQQQRLFIARAIAQDAKLYLMDEPFAGVDVKTEEEILGLLRELKSTGKTVIVVHHDLRSVARHFDEAILLNLRLIAAGPVSEVLTEENLDKAYGGKLTGLVNATEAFRHFAHKHPKEN